MLRSDSTGKKVGYLIDDNEGSAYFGGTYLSGQRIYQFRVTRYIQELLAGKAKNYDLFLQVNDPASNVLIPNRIVGTGTKPGPVLNTGRYQLQLVFTTLY